MHGHWQPRSLRDLQTHILPSGLEPVELWFAQLSDFGTALSKMADTSLAPDELDRSRRMSNDSVRVAYVSSCVLLRMVLSARLGIPPREIELVRGEHGKPVLASSAGYGTLQFNLSHGGDAWLCGVSSEKPIGVDVETRHAIANPDRLAARVFSEAERAAITARASADDTQKYEAFLRGWTRKEAVLKAVGNGFSWVARDIHVGVERGFCSASLPQKPGWQAGVWSIDLPMPGFAAAAVLEPSVSIQPNWTANQLCP